MACINKKLCGSVSSPTLFDEGIGCGGSIERHHTKCLN
jgi:hypothetical protein